MLEEKVHKLLVERLKSWGYDLVRVKWFNHRKVLQIMIEPLQVDRRLDLNECAKVSKEISLILDVEGIADEKYNLEVSSPGMDRPLVKMSDFKKYRGYTVKFVLREAVDGIKKGKGNIFDIIDDDIIFEMYNAQRIKVPFANIEIVNLVVNEDMLFKK